MATNPLKDRIERAAPPKRTAEDWCNVGNEHLASIGRAHEVHWFVQNGKATIGWKR